MLRAGVQHYSRRRGGVAVTSPRDVYGAICTARDAAKSASHPPTGGGCATGRFAMRRVWHDLEQIAAQLEPFIRAGEHRR